MQIPTAKGEETEYEVIYDTHIPRRVVLMIPEMKVVIWFLGVNHIRPTNVTISLIVVNGNLTEGDRY